MQQDDADDREADPGKLRDPPQLRHAVHDRQEADAATGVCRGMRLRELFHDPAQVCLRLRLGDAVLQSSGNGEPWRLPIGQGWRQLEEGQLFERQPEVRFVKSARPLDPSGRTPTIEKRLPFNDSWRPAIDSPPLRRSFQKRSETTTARSELPPSDTVSVRPMIGLARIVSM